MIGRRVSVNNRPRLITRLGRGIVRGIFHAIGRPAPPLPAPVAAEPLRVEQQAFTFEGGSVSQRYVKSRTQLQERKRKAAKRLRRFEEKLARSFRAAHQSLGIRARSTPRKLDFKHRGTLDGQDTLSDTSTWTDRGIRRLARKLLMESLRAIRDSDMAKRAEIWAWIDRKEDSNPLAFDECCRISLLDPDAIRADLHRVSPRPPHVKVLRDVISDAEHGDPDAVAWIKGIFTGGALAFADCVLGLGFDDVEAARRDALRNVPAERQTDRSTHTRELAA